MNTAAYAQPRTDWRSLALVAGLHGLAAFALLSIEPVARTMGQERPLVVSLIEAARSEPALEPPRPLPARPLPAPAAIAPPVLAAPMPAPAEAQVAPAPAVPVPVVAAPVETAPAAPAAVVAAAPAPSVEPPRFDADYLDNPAPAYPGLSRRLREQGQVVLRVLVDPDGQAIEVELRTSSGHDRLDRAARDTVRHWRFVPARQGDRPISAWVLVPISFSLRS